MHCMAPLVTFSTLDIMSIGSVRWTWACVWDQTLLLECVVFISLKPKSLNTVVVMSHAQVILCLKQHLYCVIVYHNHVFWTKKKYSVIVRYLMSELASKFKTWISCHLPTV